MEPPADAKAATTAPKQPPPEKPEAIRLRTKVVFSFWAVILLLGLPTWWRTTSIYRAELPLQEMLNWAEGSVRRHPFFQFVRILTQLPERSFCLPVAYLDQRSRLPLRRGKDYRTRNPEDSRRLE